ncbi:MAG: DUF2203 family protein, partial [Planctomycetota bacterium]|jgi:hypothetical protein|nr:DUF2203 family protein [Planctomycetota bacterium]
MSKNFSLAESNAALPLVHSIAREIVERRLALRRLQRRSEELKEAGSPEGMSIALSDIQAQIQTIDEGLHHACSELTSFGLQILRITPLTIHFPGRTQDDPVIFCWQEGENEIRFGHKCNEESDPRRPLRIRDASSAES